MPYWERTVRRWAAVAAVAVLGFAGGSANAARFVATFDPLFNEDFSGEVGVNVGWRGSALIDVADSCLTPGIQLVGSWFGCSSATLESGTLSFYNADTNADIQNLAWVDGPPEIYLIKVDNASNLAGIQTFPSVTFNDVTLFGDKWDIKLDFSLSGPNLTLIEDCGHKYKCWPEVFRSGQDGPGSVPQTTWSRVPEPSSLALIAVALIPLSLMRRRGRRD